MPEFPEASTNEMEGVEEQQMLEAPDPYADHKKILELIKKRKQEAFSQHSVFERQWQRVLNYIFNRQWIWWNLPRS